MTFTATIAAKDARFGKNLFDSTLDKPNGKSVTQNGWLTINLRVFLNFVDPPGGGLKNVVTEGGKTYALDYDNWMFPMLPWSANAKRDFCDAFNKAAWLWNYKFVLKTPRNYTGMDITNYDNPVIFGNKIRPNVICLFRMALVANNGGWHRKINIFNLDRSATTVKKYKTTQTKTVGTLDSFTFRSDAENYDSYDTIIPATPVGSFHDSVCGCTVIIKHNTIAHELGHAIGQPHIAGLQGDATCSLESRTQGAAKCYASSPGNVMGSGDQIWPINAYSWQQRIAEHTGTTANDWWAVMDDSLPPQLIAIP